jgi:hypothetical protein
MDEIERRIEKAEEDFEDLSEEERWSMMISSLERKSIIFSILNVLEKESYFPTITTSLFTKFCTQ